MDREDKKKIDEGNDAYNRTFLGSPTFGGLLVIGAIVVYVIYNMFFK
jgi:hypothetical protein